MCVKQFFKCVESFICNFQVNWKNVPECGPSTREVFEDPTEHYLSSAQQNFREQMIEAYAVRECVTRV